MRKRARSSQVCVLLAGLLVGMPARARWQLEWEAACLDRKQAELEVERELGRSPRTLPGSYDARVRIEPHAQGYQAAITLRSEGRSYRRTLHDASCEALAHAATVVVALTLDLAVQRRRIPVPREPPADVVRSEALTPDLSSSAPTDAAPFGASPVQARPVTSADTRGAPAEAAAVPAPTRVPNVPAPRSPWRTAVGVSAGVGMGIIPPPSFPWSLHAALLRGPLSLRARFTHAPPREATLRTAPALRGDFRLLAGALELGAGVRRGAFELPLWLGVEAGRLRGVSVEREGHAPWVGVQLTSELRYWPHARFALLLRAQGTAALTRPRFAWEEAGELRVVHRPGPVAGQLALGAEVRIR
jgi:hypothetical protein